MRSLQHLIVFIPGIGGSVLRPDGKDSGGWELSKGRFGATVARPSQLSIERELVPTRLVDSCSLLAPWHKIHGYEDMMNQLLSRFDPVTQTYRRGEPIHPGTDLLLFPYDFRRSITEAAELLDSAVGTWLHEIPEDLREKRVIVVAHSMGGLVARYWLGPLGGHRWCEALLTLGTPHRGAPKALDWLVNGVGLGPIQHSAATRVLRAWPSMYELLPQYEAVWDDGAGRAVELTEIPSSMTRSAAYAPTFAKMAADARAVHERIAETWAAIEPELQPVVVPFMGRGHATPNTAVLRDGKLTFTKDDPAWRGNQGWRGDGTVPMISAIPRELGDDLYLPLWRVTSERHGPIGSCPDPLDMLQLYAGDPVPTRGGPLPERPWVALDLEEIVPAGTEWQLRAWIEEPGPVAESMRVRFDPLDGGPPHLDRCNPDGEGWSVTVPPLPPGRYEVRVEAHDVPQHGRLRTVDTIAVVDSNTLAEDES